MREDVLKIEFERVFDKWACRIIYQNIGILKRGKFKDENIGVFSIDSFDYNHYSDELFILGNVSEYNKIIVVNDKEKEIIENKVNLINEKYGIEERWRAEKGGHYYFIDLIQFETSKMLEFNTSDDDKRYNKYNYFKTKKQAEIGLEMIKETLLEYNKTLERTNEIINSINNYSKKMKDVNWVDKDNK